MTTPNETICLYCHDVYRTPSRRILDVKVASGGTVRLCTRCVSKMYLLRIIEQHQFSESLDSETLKRIVEV